MSKNESIDVSVIIVTYNTLQMTNECISSIVEKTSGVAYEIILVDNASTDGSKEFFEKDKRIIYIYNSANYGFGKANNIGSHVAKGKYLFFLNSDTYFENDALTLFFRKAETTAKEKVGFWGTLLLDNAGHPNGCGGDFPTLMHSLALAAHVAKSHEFREEGAFESFKVDYVLGADLFMTKDVFDSLSGFDEDFFMYYEESDLQRRGRSKGYKAQIFYGPKIVHLEGKSINGITHQKRMMVETSHLQHLKKHYSKFCFKNFLVLYIILKLPVFINGHFTVKDNCAYMKLLLNNIMK